MKYFILISMTLLILKRSYAQTDIYYTQNASLEVIGVYNGQEIKGQTTTVGINLNYETTEMKILFNLNSLVFNNDTINRMIENQNILITFDGKLSLDYINTKSHPPMDFTAEGWLDTQETKTKIRGAGEIHHINDSGSYVCMLALKLDLDLSEIYNNLPEGLFNEANLVITQAILQRN